MRLEAFPEKVVAAELLLVARFRDVRRESQKGVYVLTHMPSC
jgi:hypothetical protein